MPDSGQYRVTAYLDGEKCRIEVSDSGPGFPARRALRPAAHSHRAETDAESGRGLDLIQQLSDHVQFGNRPGRGAVVSFDKVLKWREGALLTV
ncbi:serine/threonine-protein kinase RsbW [Streptomyces sp. Termitarium-T10T-6]|nr:serine/threonine-protein kinase RsbW [Streptomyces sp. Termitarium-T10T-6]